jgi:hypothetical protein
MIDKFSIVIAILILIAVVTYSVIDEKSNDEKVMLPDGVGYYIKNATLTQAFIDSVPAGETILCYGDVTVRGSIRGKGVDKTTIKVNPHRGDDLNFKVKE